MTSRFLGMLKKNFKYLILHNDENVSFVVIYSRKLPGINVLKTKWQHLKVCWVTQIHTAGHHQQSNVKRDSQTD